MPPIWVLNLKRSADRRAYITAHLAALGLDFELIEAVDGRELSPEELAAIYSEPEAYRQIGRPLTLGEIGCSLSHLRLYQRQIDEGHEEVVILEDDAILDKDFVDIVSNTKALPKDWELLLMCRGDTDVSFWGATAFGPRHRCVRFATIAYLTQGYLLRRSGAQKLLAHAYPVRCPADDLTGGAIRTGVRLYGIDPPCVRERSFEASESTMPEAYVFRWKWPTKKEMSPVRWILHRGKWWWIRFCRRANPFRILREGAPEQDARARAAFAERVARTQRGRP